MISWIIFCAFLFFLFWLVKKWSFFHHPLIANKWITIAFIYKLIVGLFVVWVYTYYYPNCRENSDIFKYYDDSQIMYNALQNNKGDYFKMLFGIADKQYYGFDNYYTKMNFWIKPYQYELVNENRTIIRLNAFFSLFTLGNFYTNALLFIFISFLGLWAIFKGFSMFLDKQKAKIYYFLLMFLPSIAFWTSGIYKESVVFFSMGILLLFLCKIWNDLKWKYIILGLIFYLILFYSKAYLALLFLPSLLFILFSVWKKKKLLLVFFSTHILIFLLFINSSSIIHKDFIEIIVNKQHDFIKFVDSLKYVGSKISIPVLDNNVSSIIQNIPNALINSFFRPHLFEVHNIMSLMSAIENAFVVLLLLIVIFNFEYKPFNFLVLISISFTLSLFILVGLTTPVLGALVRYKTPAIPFLLFFIVNFVNYRKLYLKYKHLWKKQPL